MKKLLASFILVASLGLAASAQSPVKLSLYDTIAWPQTDYTNVSLGLIDNNTPVIHGVDLNFISARAEEMHGLQAAFAYSRSYEMRGLQSAIYTISKDAVGVQWGLLNVSDNLTGVQWGLVNVNDMEALGAQIGVKVYSDRNSSDVPSLAENLERKALDDGANLIIFDTAGRLQIDADLIEEIIKLRRRVQPSEVLLVADSALGQEAVNVAKAFNEAVNITGVALTKLDGDARGGAALSIKAVSGAPIKFAGVGEKLENIEVFHPDRMAQRILGMGDVVSLVEKAQETIDAEEAAKMAEKLKKADFDLEDFLAQMRQIKKMGSLGGIMKMLPGLSGINVGEREERKMRQTEAIILSMTPAERRNPGIINARRRLRIASGSGTQVRDVNALLKQFEGMRKMMKMMRGDKGRRRMSQMMGAMRNRFPGA